MINSVDNKKEGINKIIADYVRQEYNLDVYTASPEQLEIVERILVSGKSHAYRFWDFSAFPNLIQVPVTLCQCTPYFSKEEKCSLPRVIIHAIYQVHVRCLGPH